MIRYFFGQYSFGFNLHSVCHLKWLAILVIVSQIGILGTLATAQEFQDLKFNPDDPILGEAFGGTLAIDGTTMVVGASGDLDGIHDIKGRVFVYEWLGLSHGWELQAVLTDKQGKPGDSFGSAIAIRDNFIVIGASNASNHSNVNTGKVCVFVRQGNTWTTTNNPEYVLFASDGEAGDSFGKSLELNDNWLLVGAPEADYQVIDSGAVYAYRFENASWVEKQIINSQNPLKKEHFGLRIQSDDRLTVIGAPNLGTHELTGTVSVYLYIYETQRWSLIQMIPGEDIGDHFGRSISLMLGETASKHTLVVGATGAETSPIQDHRGLTYIYHGKITHEGFRFVRDTDWIFASDGGRGDHFGFSTDMIPNLIVVGASHCYVNGLNNVGAAYVYRPSGIDGEWEEFRQLLAEDAVEDDHLGMTCAIFVHPVTQFRGVVLGAPKRDSDGLQDSGAIYMYSLN